MKDIRNDYKLVLNIPYHPNVCNLRDNMSLQLLVSEDQNFERYSCTSQSSLVKKYESFCRPCKKWNMWLYC